MSLWNQYLRKRGVSEALDDESNPVDKFKFNTDDEDYAEDYEKVQTELFKVVFAKYPTETVDFLNTIAGRGDEEVTNLLRKMRKDKGTKLPRRPEHPTDGHEFVPSTADRGHEEGGENNDQ
jgi:hypothetical protein